MKDFKVCLYLEHEGLVKISGIGTAFANQKKALEKVNVKYTTDLNGDFDILHLNFFGPRSYYLSRKYKRQGKKIVIHTHTTAEDLMNSFRTTNIISPLFKKYLTNYYRCADLLISPSPYTKRLIENTYGLKGKRIISISNGIDLEKFKGYEKLRKEFRGRYGLKGTVCVSVGHVFKRKGVHDFISVAKRFPDIHFIWFGPIHNSFLSNMKKVIQKKPSNVKFTGFVDDVRGAYAAGDVFFFPSYSENQGIVILEAAATKHPLIVRNLPTYEGWLNHKGNAMICADNQEFYESINLVLENKSLRNKLAKSSFEMSKEHNLKKIGQKLKEAYLSLL